MAGSQPPSDPSEPTLVSVVAASLASLGVSGPVVVGVSGGPDSTALARALKTLEQRGRVRVIVAHANHRLRGAESDADEAFTRALAERLGLPLLYGSLPVPRDANERGEGIEAAARRQRQQFFADTARETGARWVATAHTADDQAETVLHRIIRGTGVAGLSGIPHRRELVPGVQLIRPMLSLRRSDVIRYLAQIGQDFREDSSNRDLAFTRNRLRNELLPYLREHFNPSVEHAVCRLAALAGDARRALARPVRMLQRRAIMEETADRVVLDTAVLRSTSRFLVCEVLRRVWAERGWPLQELGLDALERVADLVHNESAAWDMPGGVRAERRGRELILRRGEAQNQRET